MILQSGTGPERYFPRNTPFGRSGSISSQRIFTIDSSGTDRQDDRDDDRRGEVHRGHRGEEQQRCEDRSPCVETGVDRSEAGRLVGQRLRRTGRRGSLIACDRAGRLFVSGGVVIVRRASFAGGGLVRHGGQF